MARTYGILVADDDEGVRRLLEIGLRQQGFAVWPAASGPEALDLYRRYRPAIDVVLLDVRMPAPDGPQTLVALREQNPWVRCLFMSGDLGRYTEWELENLGAAAVLQKPLRLTEVAQVLRGLARQDEGRPAGQ
jgi:DNA-binding response OmpR family regulator